jgi:hypothetical protein
VLSAVGGFDMLLLGLPAWIMLFRDSPLSWPGVSGDGHVLEHELTNDPSLLRTCQTAFEAAWDIAVPHHEYKPA